MAHVMEEGSCCVCSESTAEGENVIVYCDGPGCNLGTHKACYGITEIPKDDWYCQKCEYERQGHKVICALCPFRDGAFKMTNKGKWCHVICALYIPEATFQDTRRMEAISLDVIPAERFQRICYVCEDKGKEAKRYGACIPCSYPQCRFSFHVTCGHIEGLLVENVSRNSKIDYQGYCKMHIQSINGDLSGTRKVKAFRVERDVKVESDIDMKPESDKDYLSKPATNSMNQYRWKSGKFAVNMRYKNLSRTNSQRPSVVGMSRYKYGGSKQCKNQGIKPIARYSVKRARHASQSSSTTSASEDSPEGPPLLKPEIPVPGVSLLPPTLCAESKPPPIKKARKCSSSSSSANGRSSKKSHAGGSSGFLHGILTGSQGGAAARSASALLSNSTNASAAQSNRNLQRPMLPSPVDALELLGIGQPTPVSQHGLQTMEQLLEWQWNEGGQMLMQTAERGLAGDSVDTADIVSLLSCLHELKAQNERLQRQVLELENKKGHLSHVTARLADTLNKFGGSSSASNAPPVLHNGASTSNASQSAVSPIASSKMTTPVSNQAQLQPQLQAQSQMSAQIQQSTRDLTSQMQQGTRDLTSQMQQGTRDLTSQIQSSRDHTAQMQSTRDHTGQMQSSRDHASQMQSSRDHVGQMQSSRDHAGQMQGTRELAAQMQGTRDYARDYAAQLHQGSRDLTGQLSGSLSSQLQQANQSSRAGVQPQHAPELHASSISTNNGQVVEDAMKTDQQIDVRTTSVSNMPLFSSLLMQNEEASLHNSHLRQASNHTLSNFSNEDLQRLLTGSNSGAS